MANLSLERLARLGEIANNDPQFLEYGRRFRGDLAIRCGSEQGTLRIDGGRITGVSLNWSPEAPIRLAGEETNWQTLWRGMPGGLHRAWRHRMIHFDGDPQAVYGYWKMIWRLGDLMVDAGWGE